jgi:hypothetical protein
MLPERQVTDSLLIAPQAMTNSATVTANIDTLGSSYATIRVALASEINTNAVGPTLSLLQSDDTVASNFATVVANRTAEDITTAKEVTYGIDLRGKKRYLRLSVTTATTTNDNVTLASITTLSELEQRPNGTTDAGDVVVYA